MTDTAKQIALFEDRIQENNAILVDLVDHMKKYLPEETMTTTVESLFVVRYAMDMELILALRNSLGYLYAGKVNNERRIVQLLLGALNDSMTRIMDYDRYTIEMALIEKAKRSKEYATVPTLEETEETN